MAQPTRPPRIRIDLRRSLPPLARWMLALVVVAVISIAAWLVGRNEPTPPWIENDLIPALGWIYIGLVVIAAIHLLRKRAARHHEKDRSP